MGNEEEQQWRKVSQKRSRSEESCSSRGEHRDLSCEPQCELGTPDLFQVGKGIWHFKKGGTKEKPTSFCASRAPQKEPRYLASNQQYPRESSWCKRCVMAMPANTLVGVRLWVQHAAQDLAFPE